MNLGFLWYHRPGLRTAGDLAAHGGSRHDRHPHESFPRAAVGAHRRTLPGSSGTGGCARAAASAGRRQASGAGHTGIAGSPCVHRGARRHPAEPQKHCCTGPCGALAYPDGGRPAEPENCKAVRCYRCDAAFCARQSRYSGPAPCAGRSRGCGYPYLCQN